jgi:hypothetical protein
MWRWLRFPALLVPVAALVAVLPLVAHGCSCGHDFDFHLVSWFEAAAQFHAGVWHPRWAYSPAWNAGEPRFVFYPPLSWTLGALLGMVLPWGVVPVVFTWVALTAAGLGMYLLARQLSGKGAALLAALVYVANPYMMFTAYERTAYAELLAAAWIPLLLAAGLRERVSVVRVAVPVALLWLTNAPAAVMGCYALALVGLVRVVLRWREGWGVAWRLGVGAGLGIGLAAFYVVPAAYERRWVEIAMVLIEGMRIEDNFLFHRTADALHDEVLRTASWIALGLIAAAVGVLGLAWRRLGGNGLAALDGHFSDDESVAKMGHPASLGSVARCGLGLDNRAIVVVLAVVVGVIGGLLTPVTGVVWRVLPELSFLQFPWRLVAVLAAVLCGGVALAVGRVRVWVAAVVGLALVAGMGWSGAKGFRQECDDEDTVAARRVVFVERAGTDATDEYTPKGADNDSLKQGNPGYWLGADADAAPTAGAKPGETPGWFTVRVGAANPGVLILNLRAYPAWRIWVNGVAAKPVGERADGLIAVAVPEGKDTVEVRYGRTVDETVGEAISGGAAIVLLGVWGLGRRRYGIGARSVIIEG